jgi:large subunit ribosomal protein L4
MKGEAMASEVVSAKLFDVAGKEKGVVPLQPALFAAVVREELLHNTVRWQRAKKRAGTHSVLTRSEIKGGAKKPFKQKGTGNARAGCTVSPLMVGGAVVHGPTPRSYAFDVPKKMRQGALVSALTVKALNDAFVVLESIEGASGKTKDATKLLSTLGVARKKVLVVVPNEASETRANFVRSLRNVPKVAVVPAAGVNVYDLLNAETVLCVRGALGELEARLGATDK